MDFESLEQQNGDWEMKEYDQERSTLFLKDKHYNQIRNEWLSLDIKFTLYCF